MPARTTNQGWQVVLVGGTFWHQNGSSVLSDIAA
jgi:hypothetical protein